MCDKLFIKDCLDPSLLDLTDKEMAYLEQVYKFVTEICQIEDKLGLNTDERNLMELDKSLDSCYDNGEGEI